MLTLNPIGWVVLANHAATVFLFFLSVKTRVINVDAIYGWVFAGRVKLRGQNTDSRMYRNVPVCIALHRLNNNNDAFVI